MIEMTLSSRHRIRNSSPGGLRPSTLPLGHGGSPQYWLSHVDGEETFLFLSNRRDREPNPERVKGSGANHYPGAHAHIVEVECHLSIRLAQALYHLSRFRLIFVGIDELNLFSN